MTEAQAALLQRLEAFEFDDGDVTFTFRRRLEKDNGWSATYAERAIREYWRFAFLAVAAGHPVSPPDAVDQVWHLHLLYTRSYWLTFCPDVLGTPLHHEPSRGGIDEGAKFDDWYVRTCASYNTFFGEEPPADLWPDPLARAVQSRLQRFVRVDVRGHWVFPAVRVRWLGQCVMTGLLLVALLFLATGCQAVAEEPLNPLDFKGPKFLAFYGIAFVVACALAAIVRAGCRGGGGDAPAARVGLDAYAMGYLNGGRTLATHAAIAALCGNGVLRVRTGGRIERLSLLDDEAAGRLHPLERAVYYNVASVGKTPVASVRRAARAECDRQAADLKRAGFIVDDASAARAMLLGVGVTLLVPCVGMVKIAVGISRGRPVIFLVLACVASIILAFALFARRPHRTRRGDLALDHLRATHSRQALNRRGVEGEFVAAGVALFGLGVLRETELASLAKDLRTPPADSSWSSDGGGGSSDGGSSCGGGGCGGGCGGCGG